MTKKVLITGPESSGKSTLAADLAKAQNGVWVREYARDYLQTIDRPYRPQDLDYILVGQLAAEKAMEARYSLLFCDTGPEVLFIWSMHKFGQVSPLIAQTVREHTYDEIYLCYPDLEWEADPLRETPNKAERMQLFEAYVDLFQSLHRPIDRLITHTSLI